METTSKVMTPALLIGVLKVCTVPARIGDCWSDQDIPEAVAQALIARGLIRCGERGLERTERGYAFLEMLCETPLPVHRWIDPRTLADEGEKSC